MVLIHNICLHYCECCVDLWLSVQQALRSLNARGVGCCVGVNVVPVVPVSRYAGLLLQVGQASLARLEGMQVGQTSASASAMVGLVRK